MLAPRGGIISMAVEVVTTCLLEVATGHTICQGSVYVYSSMLYAFWLVVTWASLLVQHDLRISSAMCRWHFCWVRTDHSQRLCTCILTWL
jgi:hypothetical protein